MESDAELVRRCLRGETEAFGALVKRHRAAATGFCYRQVGDFDTAEDLAQEAFLSAYFDLHALREPERFGPWLRSIALRLCQSWHRRRRESPLPPEALAGHASRPSAEREALEQWQDCWLAQEALALLSEAQRRAVMLKYREGYSLLEIAELTRVPVETVRTRLRRARLRLREADVWMSEAAEGETTVKRRDFLKQTGAVGTAAIASGAIAGVPAPPTPNPPAGATPCPAGAPPPPEAPARLPRPLTRLVGREEEVCRLRELLRQAVGHRPTAVGGEAVGCQPSAVSEDRLAVTDGRQPRADGPRLVTLTGPRGVGKTRLAIQVAEACRGEFRDGACFVELAALTDPALVPQAVAAALSVREQPDRPVTETVQEFLGARELLLVLDNCEHLLDACARLVEALLSVSPALRILATSRRSLGLSGEVAWPVPGLSVPPAVFGVRGWGLGVKASGSGLNLQPPTPNALLDYGAVRLFVERARAAAPGFAFTECQAESVAQICRQLEGIPLAIELAAVRLRALTVEQIAARPDEGDPPGGPPPAARRWRSPG